MKIIWNIEQKRTLISLVLLAGFILGGWTSLSPNHTKPSASSTLLKADEDAADRADRLKEWQIESALERLEALLETHEEQLDRALDAFDDSLDSWADKMEDRFEGAWREERAERREEAMEEDVEALEEMAEDFEEQTEEALEEYEETLEEWEERLEEQLEGGVPVTMEDLDRVERDLTSFLEGWVSELEKNLRQLNGELEKLKRKYN